MKIGILETGEVAENLKEEFGGYPSMFEQLLAGQGFDFETWSVVNNVFPTGPDDADGWLITGSKHGAYEDHAWIPPLENLIRAIHAAEKPMIGVCFGHQIIAQALGGRVEKFAGGWAVGRQEYDFAGQTYAINAWHQDQVVERPRGAEVVASNAFCENAALLYGNTVYTVQPHPEFGAGFTKGLIDTRGPGVVPDALLAQADAQLDTPVNQTELRDQFTRFFREGRIA